MTEISFECDVYKSRRHEYMYIYVKAETGLERVPQALLERFGPHEVALTMTLSKEQALAREDVIRVIANIVEHGYHLQLPPQGGDILE